MSNNLTHFKVLVRKNFLALRRNIIFLICFLILPIITMGIFVATKALVNGGVAPESLNFNCKSYISCSSVNNTIAPYAAIGFDKFRGTDFNVSYGGIYASQCLGSKTLEVMVIGDWDNVDQNQAMTQMFDDFKLQTLIPVKGTEEELFNVVRTTNEKIPYCFAVKFNKWDKATSTYDADLLFTRSFVPDTNLPAYNSILTHPDWDTYELYQDSGFLALQAYMHSLISDEVRNNPFQLLVLPMKTGPYQDIKSQAVQQLSTNFPFYVLITFAIPMFYLVGKLAEEKESKAREGMKMMGLTEPIYYLSWWVFFTTVIVVMSIVIIITCIFNLFSQSNQGFVFLFFLLYGFTLFGFANIVVGLIPNQRSASLAAILLHLISYFLVFAFNGAQVSQGTKIAISLIPNCALYFCSQNLFYFEVWGTGLTSSTLNKEFQNYEFSTGLVMLFVDAIWMTLLGVYLDQVIKSDFGVSKPWYFCLMKKYWCGENQQKGDEYQAIDSEALLYTSGDGYDPTNFEAIPDSLRRQEESNECLKIRGLRKVFGSKVAVEDSNVNIYNGQIFALLGHNGAGKTTTISMLTGLIEPTKGQATWQGIDLFQDMAKMRKNLGVCPQHDVLFESLTPKEHLEIFAAFKGTESSLIDGQVKQMILDLDLVSVQNQKAKTLSGGEKRKLSVGIALIGDSKIVMLDEPTSGMDTSARRRLWEMLKQNKQGRIVILTTHYMDEADILGDRIAIMGEGKIKTCGSSLFLKSRFGVGYNLVFAKKDRKPAPQIIEFVFENIPNATKLSEVSSEISFQLPLESSEHFKDFFTLLDQKLDELNVRSYGVGVTTLEEVFLRIGKGEAETEQDKQKQSQMNQSLKSRIAESKGSIQEDIIEAQVDNEDNYSIQDQKETGCLSVFSSQFSAMLKKKIRIQLRDPKALTIEVLFPLILIVIGTGLGTIQFFYDGQPRLMTPALLPAPNHLIYNTPPLFGNPATIDLIVTEWIAENETMWQNAGTFTPKSQDFNGQISEYSDYIFEQSVNYPDGFYGQYFFYNENQNQVVVFTNATSQSAQPAYVGFICQALTRKIAKNNDIKVKISNHPFPLSLKEKSLLSTFAGTIIAIMFSIAYAMVANSLIQNIIRERERKVKQQILISGGSLVAFWLSHYVGDIMIQILPTAVGIISYNAFGADIPDAWVLLVLFLFVNPPFIYTCSFLFAKDSTGGIVITFFYFFFGGLCTVAVSILKVLESTEKIGKVLQWFFYLLPIFDLDFGIVNISNRKIQAFVDRSEPAAPLSSGVALYSVIFLIINWFIYWFLVFLIEIGAFRCKCLKKNSIQVREQDTRRRSVSRKSLPGKNGFIDEDIEEEERHVAETDACTMPVRAYKVRKEYGLQNKVVAVEDVTFGLEFGECFALLGVSGAGKTTTFKCLTGEEIPSQGTVQIGGYDVTTSQGFEKARHLIGYCPQFDAIFEGLTVKEHLEFYAAVKGVLPSHRVSVVQQQIKDMDLEEYVDIRAVNLSGGNKRKLSVAMAMIGNPPIVFLDEPSTGVDPKAKRFMWTIVSKISTMRKKSVVILTTHSMEEAEALCTKMGIMVGGRFKCFGSSQHIKDKYGTGYEVEIKVRTLSENEVTKIKADIDVDQNKKVTMGELPIILRKLDQEDLMDEVKEDGLGSEFFKTFTKGGTVNIDEVINWAHIESNGGKVVEKLEGMFKEFKVVEHYNNHFKIMVSRDNYSIGFLFGLMEDMKVPYQFSEYQVAQTTLEQIFNNFAKESAQGTKSRGDTVHRRSTKKAQIVEEARDAKTDEI